MPGPFYFAFADEGETFGVEHHVFDLRILSAVLGQDENGFATLDIIAPNPRIGLLNPDRKQWAFFARKQYDSETITLLFYGRIVGIPASIAQNRIQLTYRAEPDDFQSDKEALADTLRELPYYDPVWIDINDQENPDSVLIARTSTFHVNRTTHALTITDKFDGEDGTIDFLETDVVAASVDIEIGQPALSQVNCVGTVQWAQRASGTIDISKILEDAFVLAGSEPGLGISSYTINSLIENWPLPGDSIGGGWSVADVVLVDGFKKWITPEQYSANLVTMYAAKNVQNPQIQIQTMLEELLGASISDQVFVQDTTTAVDIPLDTIKATVIARYDANRARVENISFSVNSNIQAVLANPGSAAVKEFVLSSNDISQPVDDGDELPIGDVRRAYYLTTDRGRSSVEHLILRARAMLLDSTRAVNITFNVRFRHIFNITLRKNATITDPRLPGGFAAGKIIKYRASIDGGTGVALCSITIGCCIGTDEVLTADPGNPNYVEEGYVEDGYQTYSNKIILLPDGDVSYTDYDNVTSDDDGINFFDVKAEDMVLNAIVTNGPDTQNAQLLLNRFAQDTSQINTILDNIKTNVCIDFKPVTGGPFTTNYELGVSDVVSARGIDLEADAL